MFDKVFTNQLNHLWTFKRGDLCASSLTAAGIRFIVRIITIVEAVTAPLVRHTQALLRTVPETRITLYKQNPYHTM